MDFDRRGMLRAAAMAALAPGLTRAAAIDADVRTGTIADVQHVVILTQENRAFDHYFGAMNGVRGFADRFPVPVADAPGRVGMTNWTQRNGATPPERPPLIAPFVLNTAETFGLMRVEGTPHGWADAQDAWDQGRMGHWPAVKTERSMGYYRREDIPFQYALADAFTLCDAYHCALHTGTNSNRLFIWSGTNGPSGKEGGPSISNSHDSLPADGGYAEGYRWSTYAERLLAAGISWRVYQDMADNFTDNPMAGFASFRDSHAGAAGSDPRLAALGLSTHALDGLCADVLAGQLPQVSYIVAPAKASEHPGPSSPAQGADFTAQVIAALTADPKVWGTTVLLINFDENDGFFDHAPPPAPPSMEDGKALGGSIVDTAGEYHLVRAPSEAKTDKDELMGRPYGLGPRVPLYVVSPWSRGGWINSQVFDHTSVIRFLEQRFGVAEPNLSPWRRAVCGDLTSAFNFKTPNTTPFAQTLPDTASVAARAAALPARTTPVTPTSPGVPVQAAGPRPSRALPYALGVEDRVDAQGVHLKFLNDGRQGAVFHVYDRHHLDRVPRRYTVSFGQSLEGVWPVGPYDLWVLGPNGFHRHFTGGGAEGLTVRLKGSGSGRLTLALENPTAASLRVILGAGPYPGGLKAETLTLRPNSKAERAWSVDAVKGWYDTSVRLGGGYLRRFAGRFETGAPSISDPAMAGPALMMQPDRQA